MYIFSGSKVIAEYENGAAPGSPTREYIYSGGSLVAKIEGFHTHYYHQDHLSVRVVTNPGGDVVGQQGHYPYGESWYASSATTKWQFTTYERDAESGNDYAMARYDVNRLGRFSSPDPRAGKTGNPQSFNRYSYSFNDPLNYVDQNGAWPTWVHNRILSAAFSGILSSRQIGVLQQASYEVDFTNRGQDPSNAFRHGMCAPGEDLALCSQQITTYIDSNIAFAQAQGVLSDVGLGYLGDAFHTLSDLGSPEHVQPDGTPFEWPGLGPGTLPHILGELDTPGNLYAIGQSIRNVVAGFWQAAPGIASQYFSSPGAMAQAAIENYVRGWVASNLGLNVNPIVEDAVRQCALGNPAACGFSGFAGFGAFGGFGGFGGGGLDFVYVPPHLSPL